MKSAISVTIDGDLEHIYRIGSRIENWPNLLPHYRYVDVLWRDDTRMVARMGASRDGIPVSWMCWQERLPDEPRIAFRHIGGFTRGMQVAWTFEEHAGLVTVTIHHEFNKGWPLAALDRFVSDRIVGNFFVGAIAGKTLAQVKLLAEADRDAHRGVEVVRAEDFPARESPA
ncbi:MAG TPA: SRPBCC family protein [Thermomicrobiales bacterium]|nr:SRPBCC family protein [Thermomicrobiales bacterium]